MKRLFCKIFQGLFFLTLIWTFCGCNILSSQGMTRESDCTIISWNLQTFFDSVTDGTEYDEFKGSKSKWTKEKYQDRIDRLCDFMEEQDADIYVFVEVENIDILQDISNNLSTRSVRGGKYRYACFGKNEGGVFGCGVISKYPLENVKLHLIKLEDRSTDILEAMPSLKRFDFPAGMFTTEEIAYMCAKYPNISGQSLRAYNTEDAMLNDIRVCGYRKPGLDLPKGQARLDKYIKEFDALVEKYKAELKNNT